MHIYHQDEPIFSEIVQQKIYLLLIAATLSYKVSLFLFIYLFFLYIDSA